MNDAPEWKNMADWSDLPDVYVTKAECQQGMFWRIEACSVPMAIGPEVRLIRADRVDAPVKAAVEAEWAKYALLLAKADMALDGTVQNMAGTSVYGFQGSYFTLPALKAEIAAIRAQVTP